MSGKKQADLHTGNRTWDNWMLGVATLLVSAVVVSYVVGLDLLETFLGVTGLFFVYLGIRYGVRWTSARSIETTSIGAVGGRSETVQVVGNAHPVGRPLVAPLSGTDCVMYKIEIEEYDPGLRR